MTRERSASCVLALCLVAAAAAKLLDMEASFRDFGAIVRALGLGRADAGALAWLVGGIVAAEAAIAAALVTTRHRRAGVAAFLGLVGCGILVVGIASEWGGRGDFGCPCGLAIALPRAANAFSTLLLRDAALVALAALAWGPGQGAAPAARVRPA